MALTLTALNPTIAAPGDALVLTGTDFAPGCVVSFTSEHRILDDPSAEVVSATEIFSTVPDILAGASGQVSVSVEAPDGSSTDPLELEIEALPDVEQVQPLCSVASLKRTLGVTPTETFDDTKLQELIRIASTQIVSAARRTFGAQTYTETYDGDGTPMLKLLHGPLAEVTECLVDNMAQPIAELKYGSDWIRFEEIGEYNPRIRSAQRVFARGVRNVRVTYIAGYQVIPADISTACALQVSHLMNTITKQGLVSEANTSAGLTTTYATAPLCADAQRVCNRYRAVKIGVVQ